MTMKLLVFLSVAVAAASAVSFFEVVVEEWEAWKLIHGKSYNGDQEEKFRMKIFMENKAKIAKHNAKAMRGEKSYMLKMNEFGDLLHHEFVANMNGYRHDLRNKTHSLGATFIAPANVEFPKEVDWRTKGAVTPIKNQGTCGSCWAFSTTGSLEGQHFRRSGKLVSLSEQNLVDCSTAYGNNGCNGGLMDNAFKYIKDNGGIDTEKAYPYEAEDDQCRFTPKTVGATDKGFVDVKPGDEEDLKKAVATVGPVSVAIDASHESFQFYNHGVYHEEECSPDQLDHGVLVVGYGVDEDSGEAYWLVKNSWGTTWGLEGYIKMPRNKDNMCGIASAASYPLV